MGQLLDQQKQREAELQGAGAAVQPGAGQPLVAATQQNPNVSVLEETPLQKVVHALATAKTYVHQVAGASTIMPNGKKLVFAGKTGRALQGGGWLPGGFGYYSTGKEDEIAWLEEICNVPTSQITRLVEDKVRHVEVIEKKEADPALRQSAEDAAANSLRAADPAVAAAQNNLSAVIAKDAASKQQ